MRCDLSALDVASLHDRQPLEPPRLVSRFGVGCLRVMMTVDLSGAVIPLTALSLSALASFSSMMRRYE